MEFNYVAIGISLLAGISTGIGALPIFLQTKFDKSTLDFGMGFSAGIMLVASFISLLLPSLEAGAIVYGEHYGFIPAIIGLIIGYKVIIIMHDNLPHEHLIKNIDVELHARFSKVTMIILAICLHNIPEGLSVGVGFGGMDLSKGVSLGIGIAIQNMPEGLVVALGLMSIGVSKHKAFLLSLCSGLVEPVAALFGFISTQFSELALPFCLAFAGGAMLFVICQEMFPEIFREGHEKSATSGVLLGVAGMLTLDFLIV